MAIEIHVAAVLQEQRHKRRPSRLMTRAESGASLCVEELMERHVIAPVRVVLKVLVIAEGRAAASVVVVTEEDAREPSREFVGDLRERHVMARSSRTLERE